MSDHHQKPMSASPTSCFPWVRGQIAEYLINKILSEFNFFVKKKDKVFEKLKCIIE